MLDTAKPDPSADGCSLDVLRELHLRTTSEFHFERALHDLRNQFHAIELRVSFLEAENLRGLATPSVVHELSACCLNLRDRIEALSSDLGPPSAATGAIELEPIIARAAALARRDGAVVDIDLGTSPLPTVRANGDELAVVLVHLFDNAREANGRIHVEAFIDDDWVRIRVSDDGDSIPSDIGAKIWKPFFTTKGRGHRGHGLALAQQLLRRVDGAIELEPTDRGACFAVRLAR